VIFHSYVSLPEGIPPKGTPFFGPKVSASVKNPTKLPHGLPPTPQPPRVPFAPAPGHVTKKSGRFFTMKNWSELNQYQSIGFKQRNLGIESKQEYGDIYQQKI